MERTWRDGQGLDPDENRGPSQDSGRVDPPLLGGDTSSGVTGQQVRSLASGRNRELRSQRYVSTFPLR